MDLFALLLIASSIFTVLSLLVAGVVFAPWFIVFGAFGLLALLPRAKDVKADLLPEADLATRSNSLKALSSLPKKEDANSSPPNALHYRGQRYSPPSSSSEKVAVSGGKRSGDR